MTELKKLALRFDTMGTQPSLLINQERCPAKPTLRSRSPNFCRKDLTWFTLESEATRNTR
jgi:hypothetical protein